MSLPKSHEIVPLDLSVLQVMQISMELVTPAVWKKFHNLGKDKRASTQGASALSRRRTPLGQA